MIQSLPFPCPFPSSDFRPPDRLATVIWKKGGKMKSDEAAVGKELLEPLLREPLLREGSDVARREGRHASPRPEPSPFKESGEEVEWSEGQEGAGAFAYLGKLLRIIRPWEWFLILGLGLLNIALSRLMGYIPGDFYACLTERDWDYFTRTMIRQSVLVAICTITFGSVDPLAEYVAYLWRKRLTRQLHALYCRERIYYKIGLDNPDQRLQRDVELFCKMLTNVAKAISASPIKIVYFTWLCSYYLEPKLILFMNLYFALTLLVQKKLTTTITPIVVKKEIAEANFRACHFRTKGFAEEIAMSGVAHERREKVILNQSLGGALLAQRRLVIYHWFLSLTTMLIDYLGIVMNYGVLAVAIFTRSKNWDVDKSDLPKEISNASFVIFSLINAFSTLSDTARIFSSLLGYCTRVGEVIQRVRDLGCEDGGEDEEKRRGGDDLLLIPPKSRQYRGREFQFSVHEIDSMTRSIMPKIFPGVPKGDTLLWVPTFQCAAMGVDLNPSSGSPEDLILKEMNTLFANFADAASRVREELTLAGYFCDAINPRTGLAMHSASGEKFSEAYAARSLLGYTVAEYKGCPIIAHPEFGSGAYPASIFTNAPAELVAAQVEKALCMLCMERDEKKVGSPWLAFARNATLLQGSKFILRKVSFELMSDESLYVCGPSGCGKTSLVKALCKLIEINSGEISMPDQNCVVVLSQKPLLVHGKGIREQIVYPHTTMPAEAIFESLLARVGLSHLMNYSGSVPQLSKADVQKICVARVLYHKPLLAILDDALSALSESDWDCVYALFREERIAFITTGSDPGLGRLHTHVLHLPRHDDR